jgi:HK97 family phage major capsid protein
MSTLSCAFASMAKELGGLARKLKTADDSNESLVGAGVTDTIPLLLGLPVLVNREMPSYSGVMLDRSAVVSAVGEVYVSVSEHRYFKFNSQLLRITWRIGQSVVRPDRCGTFTVAAPGS